MGIRRVFENELEFEERTDIEAEWDEDGEEWFKVIDDSVIPPKKTYAFDSAAFCYPDFIEKNEMYAEDIQEAIIQHLIAHTKMTREQLEMCRFEFFDPDGNRWVNSQILKIRWKL